MTYKNNKAAEAILKREPGAAEQVGNTPLLLHNIALGHSRCSSVNLDLVLIDYTPNFHDPKHCVEGD